MTSPWRSAAVLILALVWGGCGHAFALPEDAAGCMACHGDKSVAPVPKLGLFDRSAHKDLSCSSCHGDAAEVPHPVRPGAVDCGTCHAGPASGMKASAHGVAMLKSSKSAAAACAACHGPAHETLAAALPASAVSRLNQPGTCGACHGDPSKVPAHTAARRPLESYLETVHGRALRGGNAKAAACADCHGSHDIRPPGDPSSRVDRRRIVSTCGACHAQQEVDFRASIHGAALTRGAREAPGCTDCHGEHTILPPKDRASSVWAGAVTKTCVGCHDSERIASKFGLATDRVQTFMESFHGLAGRSGDLKVANCASCHGWHDVLPSSDARSRVHPANLPATCGQCHPGAGARLASDRVHGALAARGGGSDVAAFFRTLYLILIPLIVGAMLAHNGIDLLRKVTARQALGPLRQEEEVSLTVSERLQHGALILSFTLLAYSGFALKYPGSWWTFPMFLMGGEEPRRTFHRAAAVLFIALAAVHAAYLLFTAKGRGRLRELLPRFSDAWDAGRLVRFNMGLAGKRPLLPRFSYIEKAEYWALMWGSGVMVLTGAVLVFHNFSLAHFPLWLIEVSRVVHYLEAVLACLSILVWHLYWVVYDPDVYPMNWSWLTGRTRLHPLRKDRPSGGSAA